MDVGVLALQGAFRAHIDRLRSLGAQPREVRTARDSEGLDAIVLPGGESSAMLKLMTPELRSSLVDLIRSGLPTLATCAGVILLAKRVTHPEQQSLGLLDVDVKRNAYGRQTESFIERCPLTPEGREDFLAHGVDAPNELESVFIRAPIITRAGKDVRVLLHREEGPTAVRQGSILGATFHPELSGESTGIHALLLALAR